MGINRDEDVPGARFVPKGWGNERWLVNTEDYCGKELLVLRGKQCSWHYHKNKDETFLVIEGMIRVRMSDDDDEDGAAEFLLSEGDSLHVPPGTRHSFYGVSKARLIEFSTHHKDSDSIRLRQGDVLKK